MEKQSSKPYGGQQAAHHSQINSAPVHSDLFDTAGGVMSELLIPYGATNQGKLVSAAMAVANEEYCCPSCEKKLVLRAGEKRQRHFAHPSEGGCSYESIIHNTAKYLIAQVVQENANGDTGIIDIQTNCDECKCSFKKKLPLKIFSGSDVEVQIGKYRCDAVAYRGQEIALAFEILFSSPVSSEKEKNLDAFWVELLAEEVICNPYLWRPVRSHLKETCCPTCNKKFKEISDAAKRWNIDESLFSVRHKPSHATYIAGLKKCLKCKEVIPVFWWRGVPFCQNEPPKPRPKTIQWRNSKQFGGSYWVNTCPNCKLIQGDNHIFVLEGAPLGDLPKTIENIPEHARDSATKLFASILTRNGLI